jgi:hypothetical protein
LIKAGVIFQHSLLSPPSRKEKEEKEKVETLQNLNDSKVRLLSLIDHQKENFEINKPAKNQPNFAYHCFSLVSV